MAWQRRETAGMPEIVAAAAAADCRRQVLLCQGGVYSGQLSLTLLQQMLLPADRGSLQRQCCVESLRVPKAVR